jgi:hypothetical protein
LEEKYTYYLTRRSKPSLGEANLHWEKQIMLNAGMEHANRHEGRKNPITGRRKPSPEEVKTNVGKPSLEEENL